MKKKQRTAGWGAFVRTAAGLVAGVLVGQGIATEGMEQEITGAIIAVVNLIWFQFDRSADAADRLA